MIPFALHPDHDELMAHLAGDVESRHAERITAHVRECPTCQEDVRFLGRLSDVASVDASLASPAILTRALATRDAGSRRILPSPDADAVAAGHPARRRPWGWAALVQPDDVAAIGADSEMHLLPVKPHAGDSIRVVYRPSALLFRGATTLVLRARLRISGDEMYASAVPASRVRAVAVLARNARGEFTGSFALPDSVVFASLVVEDSAAGTVDENGGRLWETLVHDAHGQPTFASLNQRINDMMGRSWEEAYATSKRLTVLYPDNVASWTLRRFFDNVLYGQSAADSLGRAYQAVMDRTIALAKGRETLSDDEIGRIFYDARYRARRPSATRADSAEFDYWLRRTTREHPRHAQLAQHYAFNFTPAEFKRPAARLDSLEHLYATFAPLAGPGMNLASTGQMAATSLGDEELMRRWSNRLIAGNAHGDSAYVAAMALAERAASRREGMVELRRLLASPPEAVAGARRLTEDRREYLHRADDARRKALATLGRALVAEGATRAGTDTLGLAARGAWNPVLFRTLRIAYDAAGDSAGSLAMRVRLAVDPRTRADSAAAMTAWGRTRLGARAWDSLTTIARGEMHERLLARSTVRSLRGSPSATDGAGKSVALRELTAGRAAAVIFWSRNCGYAIEALPAITRIAERLTRDGRAVLLVVDEAPGVGVARYLAERKWTLPVYYDQRSEMRTAFSNFGTPAYYVLDAAGRVRFKEMGEGKEAELVAQMEAVAAEQGTR